MPYRPKLSARARKLLGQAPGWRARVANTTYLPASNRTAFAQREWMRRGRVPFSTKWTAWRTLQAAGSLLDAGAREGVEQVFSTDPSALFAGTRREGQPGPASDRPRAGAGSAIQPERHLFKPAHPSRLAFRRPPGRAVRFRPVCQSVGSPMQR